MRRRRWLLLVAGVMLPAASALAAPALGMFTVTPAASGGQTYSLSIQLLLLMTALSFLPAALIMMTSFTRIVIVLALLRQGLGTAQTPSNQILVGLALFLTLFIMFPVFQQGYNDGVKPYMNGKISEAAALQQVEKPLHKFMLLQTRDSDLAMFTHLSGRDHLDSPTSVPFSLLLPAYVTSELKTAFQIGFLILIPFLVIDLVVASVLMSLGMVMLSPLIISLPFKLMLFVLVDGWTLIMGTLASSFYH